MTAVRALALLALVLGAALAAVVPAGAAAWPAPADGTYVVPQFRFADGETMANLRLHYVLMPLASLPVQISGRNRVWRDMIVDDLRNDPGYRGGDYATQPSGLKAAVDMLWIFGSAPLYDQSLLPTRDAADAYYEDTVKRLVSRYDANDMIYQFESSRDYDPEPDLGKITAPLVAVNSADDQINPPELGVMEREIRHVARGRFVLLPIAPQTRGHGTHTLPAIWGSYLDELLRSAPAR